MSEEWKRISYLIGVLDEENRDYGLDWVFRELESLLKKVKKHERRQNKANQSLSAGNTSSL